MGRNRRPVERSQTGRSDMQIKETIGVSFPGSVESPPPEDVVVLVDGAGVALGVRPAVSAKVRGVRTDIAPDLWDFDADQVELYVALLNLCRNTADAIPDGGAITVAARNVEPSAGAARGFVEIVVADDGEGMLEEVLSQAFTPYFTTKAAGSGTGLGLLQVQRFAEGRGGAVGIESRLGVGTLVRLFLPRVGHPRPPSSRAGRKTTYTPSPSGGVFHIVNPAKAAPTS